MIQDSGEYENRPRKVFFYGRVSTEFEAQIAALNNQMEWYDALAKENPNWTVVGKYEDEGISGTRMKTRPAFMKMLRDAKRGKFDLIVTREVSRFARNTVDTLIATRDLKQYGVEVYFVNDGIWTMSGDGEVRLTIMASLAQDESRKMGERIKAGIKVAESKGTYFPGKRPYGYTFDPVKKTLVIQEDQAEVVRKIYEWYMAGLGRNKIAKRLTEEGRPNCSGKLPWTPRQVGNLIRNASYKGYKTYNQSHTSDFINKIRVTHDESEYVYVKSNFDPIISEEVWDACNKRMRRYANNAGNDRQAYKHGKNNYPDKWACRMFCSCGARMVCRGKQYVCYRRERCRRYKKLGVEFGARENCSMPYVSAWKLEAMAEKIFQKVWKEHKDEMLEYFSAYNKENVSAAVPTVDTAKIEAHKKSIADTQEALRQLETMRSQNLISVEEYTRVSKQYQTRITHEREDIERSAKKPPRLYDVDKIKDTLEWNVLFPDGKVSDDFLDRFVARIISIDGELFVWDLNLSQKLYTVQCFLRGTYWYPYVLVGLIEEANGMNHKKKIGKGGKDLLGK